MSETAAPAPEPMCAGCGMHFAPLGRAKTARPPGGALDVPVCSRACQDAVQRFGTLRGWHP